MGLADTPPEPLPVRRQPTGEHVVDTVDPIWFHEWRRELVSTLKEIRRDSREALAEIGQRLLGIEGKIAEGEHATDKHDQQIMELAAETAEHSRRLDAIERQGGSGLVRRVVDLEADKDKRERADIAAQAVADAAAKSPLKKYLGSMFDGAARTLGPMLVGAIATGAIAYARWILAEHPPAAPAAAGIHP